MSQATYTIIDETGAEFLIDINNQLGAIQTNNSGASDPAETAPYMWWADTTATIMKMRNAADGAWINIFDLVTGLPSSQADAIAEAVAPYRNIHFASAFAITTSTTAGTYDMAAQQVLQPAANGVGGTHSNTPINDIYIASADFPSVGSLTTKMRIRASLLVNDVAPTGNYTVGLYPITRPGTSGGIAAQIITLGVVVPGSTVAFNTPSADAMSHGDSGDFDIPADGDYVIGIVLTAQPAVNSRVDIKATLQVHNT